MLIMSFLETRHMIQNIINQSINRRLEEANFIFIAHPATLYDPVAPFSMS